MPRMKLSAQPMAKPRSRKVRSWMIGVVPTSMRRTNTAPASTLAASKASTGAASQPRCGASFKPICRLARQTASKARPAMSSVRSSARSAASRARRASPSAQARMPGATLMRNSQCHEVVCVIQPPTTGPTVGASTASRPAMVVAKPCSRNGKSRNTAENTSGTSMPPKKPCATRAVTSEAKPVLAAQPIEASVKAPTAIANSTRMPSARVSRPVSGIAITSAMR